MLDAIRLKHRRTWWAFVVRGLLAVAVGILIIARPLDSLAALALLVAIWAMLSGVLEIIQAWHIRSVFESWWLLLLGGLIGVAFGVAALHLYPELSLAFITTWVGLWLFVTGTVGIYSSTHMKRSGLPWVWAFVWGVVSVAASAIAFVDPRTTLTVILALLAAYAMVSGVSLLLAAWRIRSIANHFSAILHP